MRPPRAKEGALLLLLLLISTLRLFFDLAPVLLNLIIFLSRLKDFS